MAWSDLRREVLEQFCAPEWFDAPLTAAVFRGDLSVYSDTSKIASRKADESLTERVLAKASERLAWKVGDLVAAVGAAGETERGVQVSVGITLRRAGWVQSDRTGKPSMTWLNVAGIIKWWAHRRAPVRLREVQELTGVPPNTMKRFARSAGWEPTRSVWYRVSTDCEPSAVDA